MLIADISDKETLLLKDGQVIARASQTGTTIDNILKEVECGKYGN